MTEHEPEEPTATQQVISQIGVDMKAAVAAVAAETPELAEAAAKLEVSRRFVRWLAVIWVSAVVAALGAAYLMLTYYPRPHAADITFHHGDVLEECTRVPSSPPDHPVFVCRPDLR